MKDIEIKEYMDKKFDKLETKTVKSNRWLGIIVVMIVVAIITSGLIGAKAVGSLEARTDLIYKEYVPGDLLWVVMYSYDLQNEYTLSLLNGDMEGAEEKFKEFVQFRKDMYEKYFQTRGFILPTEGRVVTKR